jgi:hypothetical protein
MHGEPGFGALANADQAEYWNSRSCACGPCRSEEGPQRNARRYACSPMSSDRRSDGGDMRGLPMPRQF